MNIKRERFIRLANKRVNKTLKQIDLVKNLSNKNNYEYTENDIEQIFKALEQKIKDCKVGFLSKANDKDRFNIE